MPSFVRAYLAGASLTLAAVACGSFSPADATPNADGGADGGASDDGAVAGFTTVYSERFDDRATLTDIERNGATLGSTNTGMTLTDAVGAPSRALQIKTPDGSSSVESRYLVKRPATPSKIRLELTFDVTSGGGVAVAGLELPTAQGFAYYFQIHQVGKDLRLRRFGASDSDLGPVGASAERFVIEIDTRARDCRVQRNGAIVVDLKDVGVEATSSYFAWYGALSVEGTSTAGTYRFDDVVLREAP